MYLGLKMGNAISNDFTSAKLFPFMLTANYRNTHVPQYGHLRPTYSDHYNLMITLTGFLRPIKKIPDFFFKSI